MSNYTRAQFGATVREDFSRRRAGTQLIEKSMQHSFALETKALGHPDYETLDASNALSRHRCRSAATRGR